MKKNREKFFSYLRHCALTSFFLVFLFRWGESAFTTTSPHYTNKKKKETSRQQRTTSTIEDDFEADGRRSRGGRGLRCAAVTLWLDFAQYCRETKPDLFLEIGT